MSAGLVEQPCSATVSRLFGSGMGPDLRLLRSGGGAAETDFNGALSAAETALTGAVCFHDRVPFLSFVVMPERLQEKFVFLRIMTKLLILSIVTFLCLLSLKMSASDDARFITKLSTLCIVTFPCLLSWKMSASDDVRPGVVLVLPLRCLKFRLDLVVILEFMGLLGACGVGSASDAVGSVCLPAVCTRSYADVAASACGGMAVEQRHACNSVVSGGFLPVQKSTSYNLGTGRQGPTWRRGSKGGVSSPARRFAPCLRGGGRGKFSAGWWWSEAGCRFTSKEATRNWYQAGEGKCGHTFPPPGGSSPGYGLDIRQSVGWTKVCGTTQSGIWVLKGNSRTRTFPANLDYLRVEWIKQVTYETAWVTPGHDCLCSYKYGHGAVRPQANDAIWNGVIGLWSRVAPFLSPWCGKKDVPTGVNLNQYAGPGSLIRWLTDTLFCPQNSPKLIVSPSLGNSVEFMVRRRAPGKVPSSIRLDHGDVLVMGGLAQSEYEHCTASGLQGPRVNLTYRWVAQHTASCPLAGVVGCVLPTCAQGLVEPSSRWLGEGENK